MSRRLVRSALVAVISSAALVGAGCNKEAVVTSADTEGVWIQAGALNYHIQGSRILNPGETPDSAYLKGIPAGTAPFNGGKEVWFAVFLRIENNTSHPAPTANQFEIRDTVGDTYSPLNLDTQINPFAYKAITLPPAGAIPAQDSPQAFNSMDGAELLFRIPLTSYANRPLEFRVHAANGSSPPLAKIDLDV